MKRNYFLIVLLAILLLAIKGQTCSSFMLKTMDEQIYGHNLNTAKHIPGLVFINKRGVIKQGHTWAELTSNIELNSIRITWKSTYGSVTFNAFGRDFPDGGMNEKGLFIWEMTGKASFDKEENRPRLFMAQWMQYQLDNYKSVSEVLENLNTIGLDGWNWHFFVADTEGQSASIEFIDGEAVVNTGENMPVPLMGNGRYSNDISFLKEFKGFGGEMDIELENPQQPGFIRAAFMIQNYDRSDKIVDYGFKVLKKLSSKAKWSIIFDVKNMKVYYRTALRPKIKSFEIQNFDFAKDSQLEVIDIQKETSNGDVSSQFVNFSDELNLKLTQEISGMVYNADQFQISKEELANNFAKAYKVNIDNEDQKLEGEWVGKAEYPTTGEPAIVEWKLSIADEGGKTIVKITDSAGLFKETEMKNMSFKNGILQFSICTYGYVFRMIGIVGANEMRGVFDISDESRKGNFKLTRQ